MLDPPDRSARDTGSGREIGLSPAALHAGNANECPEGEILHAVMVAAAAYRGLISPDRS